MEEIKGNLKIDEENKIKYMNLNRTCDTRTLLFGGISNCLLSLG